VIDRGTEISTFSMEKSKKKKEREKPRKTTLLTRHGNKELEEAQGSGK